MNGQMEVVVTCRKYVYALVAVSACECRHQRRARRPSTKFPLTVSFVLPASALASSYSPALSTASTTDYRHGGLAR